MRKAKKMLMLTFAMGVLSSLQAQLTVSHDFNNGRLAPFESCTTQNPNYVRVINNRVKTFWTSEGYNGTRMDKGAEFCGHELGEWLTYKEGWCGVKVTLGNDYPKNKTGAIMQIMGRFLDREWSTWSSEISIHNGDLKVRHRAGAGSSNTVDRVIYRDFPYVQEVNMIVHFILSNQNNGLLEFWINGRKVYTANNINFGLGEFRNDRQIPGLSRTIFKLGQYNYDDTGYERNETRTVYYDDVTWYTGGSEGYNRVNPDAGNSGGGTGGGGTASGDIVHMRKRNANGYAIDGNGGGANAQNIYIWAQNTGNINQQWVEINRGGGYYSYQKRGTNYCIDGGRGGANGQNVYLWTCGTGNQNQHWRKANMGSGNFRLEKRNASGFSLDGGRGGANRQNLYLWANNNANRNQHWFFTNVGSAKSLVGPEALADVINVFPNPMVDTFSVDIAELESAKVSMYSTNGKLIFEETVEKGLSNFTLNNVTSGLYLVQIEAGTQLLTKKLLKK